MYGPQLQYSTAKFESAYYRFQRNVCPETHHGLVPVLMRRYFLLLLQQQQLSCFRQGLLLQLRSLVADKKNIQSVTKTGSDERTVNFAKFQGSKFYIGSIITYKETSVVCYGKVVELFIVGTQLCRISVNKLFISNKYLSDLACALYPFLTPSIISCSRRCLNVVNDSMFGGKVVRTNDLVTVVHVCDLLGHAVLIEDLIIPFCNIPACR